MLRILSSKWTSFSRRDSVSGSFDEANEEPTQESEDDNKIASQATSTSQATFFKPDGTLNYDALYEDSEEPNISIESQGSVVTHLLSQVKIGMDLTKVALPTFILERRSLLEMYADYFAHPDMFVKEEILGFTVAEGQTGEQFEQQLLGLIKETDLDILKLKGLSFDGASNIGIISRLAGSFEKYTATNQICSLIADLTTERERMVQVVQWYLCSYHAGRKSSVAKKPYNPVLGEVFQCYWNIPGLETINQVVPITDGPVPWSNGEQLSFIAEQISHHPPISAFYAEHYNKRITFTAHVWTKSKFLGLSIGVHNIGNGVIDVLRYDEQYVVTFPNGYGRSILTVPWIELGGTVMINCEKTGYRAVVEFLTKPFYGGKKHRINCEIFSPNEKKPFLTVTGQWNGLMEAKWSDGRSEQFANVNNLTIVKKIVRPLESQNDNESRKLWKEVTAGLRLNNVVQASNAKSSLEQKQRLEAQQRKEMGIEWETKLFHRNDDDWVYINPLSQRLNSKTNISK